jgi:argininosuccinate synthase
LKNFFKWIRIKAKLRIVWINNWRILQMGKPNIKTIGVLTSGGDAPAMNAAVRAVARIGKERGLKVKGIRKGYNGLLNEDIIDLTPTETADTIFRGGTILFTARCEEFKTEEGQKRGAEICKAHGIDLPFDASHSYSRDRNLWHISHEGLELEDPSQAPNYDNMLVLGVTPEKAPDKETEVTMTFEQGVPKTLNGKEMKVSEIITELNKLGGENGIGIVDIVENRVVGMKSRGVYETPGGTILMAAHEQLEELTLDRETMETKKKLGSQFAQVVYEGKWYTPLREAIQAFVESTQKYVTGEVKFKLYKGNIIKAGTTSPYSLYNESLASFTTGDLYDHHDADGFITLFGLPLKVRAMMLKEVEQNKK